VGLACSVVQLQPRHQFFIFSPTVTQNVSKMGFIFYSVT
jgi:hypothetical protein